MSRYNFGYGYVYKRESVRSVIGMSSMPRFWIALWLILVPLAWADEAAGDEVHVRVGGHEVEPSVLASIIGYGVDWESMAQAANLSGPLEIYIALIGEDLVRWENSYDPEKAKSMLEESSYDGRSITLLSVNSDEYLARTMTEYLERIGLHTRVDFFAPNDLDAKLSMFAATGVSFIGLRAVRKPTVPDLGGSLLDDAKAAHPDLSIEEAGREPSDDPPGTIVRQDPPAGEALPSDHEFWRVRVWLAEGPIAATQAPSAPPETQQGGEGAHPLSLWLWGILGALILLLSGYGGWRWFFHPGPVAQLAGHSARSVAAGGRGRTKRQLRHPEIRVQGVRDHGQQSIKKGAGMNAPDFAFRIQIDPGQQSISVGG